MPNDPGPSRVRRAYVPRQRIRDAPSSGSGSGSGSGPGSRQRAALGLAVLGVSGVAAAPPSVRPAPASSKPTRAVSRGVRGDGGGSDGRGGGRGSTGERAVGRAAAAQAAEADADGDADADARALGRRRLLVATRADAAPSLVLPTDIAVVPETALPYYLSQGPDGAWTKIDDAWLMYGRRAGSDEEVAAAAAGFDVAGSTSAAATSTTWAVAQALPSGWGTQTNRSSFYKVPLIVVASVVLSVGIIIAVIFIVMYRRRARRRRKRHEARLRRKALRAAGLDNAGAPGADVILREKLEELERQHRAKRRPAVMVKTKVRAWRSGLRRRRRPDAAEDGVAEGKLSREITRESGTTVDTNATGTSGASGSRSGESAAASVASDTTTPRPASPLPSTPTSSPVPPATDAAVAFPPAYRPASVRSNHASETDPTDKTSAPGFYPAPTTADAETAIAVAGAADGKSRAILPSPDDDEGSAASPHTAHVATDDKRELERIRLGASAPGVVATGVGAVASAPEVDVDEAGFERIDEEGEEQEEEGEAGPSRVAHGSLPLPPAPTRLHSLTTTLAPPLPEVLAPSAPPGALDAATPSAPPLLDDDDENPDAATVPSAPVLDDDSDDAISYHEPPLARQASQRSWGVGSVHDGAQGEREDGDGVGAGGGARRQARPVFLPRYEP
ncbi:hypothetical protein Q5752_005560 [Cryptotrichosporon argae]